MKQIAKMTGYKATDKDMKCRGYQYEIGKWYEHDGDLDMCSAGFHFCKHLPGVWAYYNDPTTRVFEVEAEEVLADEAPRGADEKLVCRKIRLVKEVTPGADKDASGNGNRNSGNRNSGNGNSGDRNSGDGNSGDGNATNRSAGFFCLEEPRVISFDVQTDLTFDQFVTAHPEYSALCDLLTKKEAIDFDRFKGIPGITQEKLKALHEKHLKVRGMV